MASSKRSRAPRSKSSRAVAPKAAPAPQETHAAEGSSPASAILSDRGLQRAARLAKAPAPPPAVAAPPAVVVPPAAAAVVEAAAVVAPRPSLARAAAPAAPRSLSVDERRDLVARLAYLRAEGLGFGRTNPVEDWLWAEQEVNRMMHAHAA